MAAQGVEPLIEVLRTVQLPDYDGEGNLQIDLINEFHPVFGIYIMLRGTKPNKVEVKIPFSHMVDIIQVVETSTGPTFPPAPLRDFQDNGWVYAWLGSKIDHLEHKALVSFKMKDLGIEAQASISQKELRENIAEIRKSIPADNFSQPITTA